MEYSQVKSGEINIQYIKGVGEKRLQLLEKLGIKSLDDLVHFYPRDYLDFTDLRPISKIEPSSVCVFRATVGFDPVAGYTGRGKATFKTTVTDGTGTVHVTIFNSRFAASALHAGEEYLFYGKVTKSKNGLEMANPTMESLDREPGLRPVYPLTAGITSGVITRIIENALPLYFEAESNAAIPDDIRRKFNIAHEKFALSTIHFPKNKADLEIARRSLIFEELLTLQAGMRLLKSHDRGKTDYRIERDCSDEFIGSLPFTLTGAQLRTVRECIADMKRDIPMNRLVQGDVGSGKTAVAAVLLYTAAKNGMQSAMMAPTEILAGQHFNTLSAMMKDTGLKVALLTGSATAKSKREIKQAVAQGEIDILVGTHALLSEDVAFSRLGFVVTDEQHRFGVRQRGTLASKGLHPHTFVMSATPIPRTLSLIIYGDLDLSVIDELPKGRQKISTYAVDSSYRKRIYSFIRKHLDKGLQAYIVCPLVEEGESDLISAGEYAEALKEKEFADYRIGLLHGKMKAKDKEKTMSRFLSGEIQLLVSTTVVEVGVDVPNAVIMVVENAERFGLSQLHQLRGRVGRGKEKSYCILITDAGGENAKARMEIMCRTNDGFQIADKDLELRGPGDFFGSRQHGLPELKIASLTENMDLVRQTRSACDAIFHRDPELKEKENAGLKAAVKKLFSEENHLSLN
ncbi:MAG: ATP-dependent DNA helicase RecG [Acutalibacteraceae bacterium]